MILAVTGGKGGVGKSTVALNLAAALDAVVVDADLGMADLPEARGPDLHDVLAGRADPAEAVREDEAVAILPCGRSLTGARGATSATLATVLAAVADAYGPVVVDCPAGLRSDAGVPLLAADACILVTRPEEAALTDALRARELARTLDTPLARVVLNRAEHLRTADVATTLGAPVTAIPESESVARAQGAGVPVGSLAPECPAAAAFEDLATAVYSALDGNFGA
ncbi:P-loop NTPase [Halobacteriales archaeon Cl-PHB]